MVLQLISLKKKKETNLLAVTIKEIHKSMKCKIICISNFNFYFYKTYKESNVEVIQQSLQSITF